MRLKKIKLAGFKSFVDPTSVSMPGNLIGVVGPNGCGKSNIIDAVRWVMGESSAKHLRGESMTDVIFNGSSTRKPVGQASIELLFDNSDGAAGGQYAAYNEISIRRLLTRESQSTYFLNGTRCRRRDVTDIFMGTGLGPRSYAIIEQGMISRLIEAKPEELRNLLEEAAGISKYKERRRETETRLRHTHENLSRLSDIREEIGKRIGVLDRQAKAAEQYKVLKQESREIKAQALVLRWQTLQIDVEKQLVSLREDENKLEEEQAELRSVETSTEKQRQQRGEDDAELNTVQARYYELGADIARLEESVNSAKDKKAQQKSELESAEHAWAHANAHIEQDNSKVIELQQSLTENEPRLEQLTESEQANVSALAGLEALMNTWQEAWDVITAKSAEQQRVAEVERERGRHLEQRRSQFNQQNERLDSEIAGINLSDDEAEIEKLETASIEASDKLGNARQRLETYGQTLNEQRQKQATFEQDLEQKRGQRQKLTHELASLQGLQQAALGGQQEQVGEWLEQSGLADAKRLANIVDVDEGWEQAVESVLDFHLQAVCVDDLDSYAQVLDKLEQGELELLSLAGSESNASSILNADSLASKVKAPEPVLNLLSRVSVCDSIDQALAIRSRLAEGDSVVTRAGIWFGPSWVRVLKPNDEAAGVLAREKVIQHLQSQSDSVDSEIESQRAQLTGVAEEIDNTEAARENLQAELATISSEHAKLREQLSGKKAHLAQRRSRLEQIQVQLKEVSAGLETTENELGNVQLRLHEALSETEQVDISRSSLSQEREGHVSQLASLRTQAQTDRDAKHQLALSVESMRTQLRLTKQSLERMTEQLQTIGSRREQLQLSLTTADEPIEKFSADLEQKLEQRLQVEASLNKARDAVATLDNELMSLDKRRHEIDQKIEKVRTRLESSRVHMGELKVRTDTVVEQVEESGYKVEEVVESLPEDADDALWQQRLEKIDAKIRRLEPVNLAAIDEYKSETERKTYLDAQNEDLTEAIATLEEAIGKIDGETRMRFKETFDKVNSGIKEKFPRLFGGGEAYLEMTGTDLLDTGVTVMARPPGKCNSTIQLLSGGEKALTAVAMVFAIFELTPAPFCMLDEVDAPLDDANVGRFCELVKEMSKTVQFIFVSHNKVTMELADQLLGVTMNEPGVSRLVAVDVDEAVAMTDGRATG
ncbi:MAG: chromosome segregation protein SMC [Thiotrichales bacterium]|nr:chromosome segregation protein SMC [Thiotrichales bacterium]